VSESSRVFGSPFESSAIEGGGFFFSRSSAASPLGGVVYASGNMGLSYLGGFGDRSSSGYLSLDRVYASDEGSSGHQDRVDVEAAGVTRFFS